MRLRPSPAALAGGWLRGGGGTPARPAGSSGLPAFSQGQRLAVDCPGLQPRIRAGRNGARAPRLAAAADRGVPRFTAAVLQRAQRLGRLEPGRGGGFLWGHARGGAPAWPGNRPRNPPHALLWKPLDHARRPETLPQPEADLRFQPLGVRDGTPAGGLRRDHPGRGATIATTFMPASVTRKDRKCPTPAPPNGPATSQHTNDGGS